MKNGLKGVKEIGLYDAFNSVVALRSKTKGPSIK